MKFIETIKKYSSLLKECAIWHNSKDILAPIFTEKNLEVATSCYIYEFYCYISIVVDLKKHYEISFKPGKGKFKYKFPQAASNKEGKPLFFAHKNGITEFQICAGTKIDGVIDTEENHPDISFQLPDASDKPTHKDLIIILDAKFNEREEVLPKTEVYKFGMIVDLFELRGPLKKEIHFHNYKGLDSNCLITNGKSYSSKEAINLLKRYNLKEVSSFCPDKAFEIIG